MFNDEQIYNDLQNINTKYFDSIKELALKQVSRLLKEFSNSYDFNKYVYYLMWEGDAESNHSFSGFGDENDNFYTDSYIGDVAFDYYKDEFFGTEETLPVILDRDKENLEFLIEHVVCAHIGFDYVIEATKNDQGEYDIKLISASDFDGNSPIHVPS